MKPKTPAWLRVIYVAWLAWPDDGRLVWRKAFACLDVDKVTIWRLDKVIRATGATAARVLPEGFPPTVPEEMLRRLSGWSAG